MFNFDNYKRNINEKIKSHIENSSKKILLFGERFELENKNIKILYLNDLNNLNLEKNIFDQIILYHGLEKILDPKVFLLKIRKNLIKNGSIIFVIYNFNHLSNIGNILNQDSKDALIKENVNYFSYKSIKNLINDVGFEILSEEIYANFLNRKDMEQIIKITKNPYLAAYSFIIKAKKIDTFPFL